MIKRLFRKEPIGSIIVLAVSLYELTVGVMLALALGAQKTYEWLLATSDQFWASRPARSLAAAWLIAGAILGLNQMSNGHRPVIFGALSTAAFGLGLVFFFPVLRNLWGGPDEPEPALETN